MTLVGIFRDETFDFPLKKTDVEVSTIDDVASVVIVQTYFNNSNKRVECNYRFPLYRNATIHNFTIKFASGKIVCKVKEAEEAKKVYTEAVTAGKKAALLTEKTREEYDVVVGNVDASETVVVTIKYIVHLSRDLETEGRKFILPTTITPRYDNRPKVQPDWDMPTVRNPPSLYNRTSNGNTVGSAFSGKQDIAISHDEPRPDGATSRDDAKNVQGEDVITYSELADAAPLGIKMYIVESKGLAHVSIPKWSGNIIRKQKFDDNRFYCEIEGITLGEDFIVTIIPEDDEDITTEDVAPVIWGEKYINGTPTFKILFNEKNLFKVDTEKKYEFIMVIDRSGSMMGKQITNARYGLGLLLNALPVDSYFNIYGFGSTWRHFYPKSVKYTKDTFEESKRMVDTIQADMGGTEMNSVLEAIYKTPKIPGYDRKIILLTDGEVYDLQSIFDIVKSDDVPVFTIGVGNSVSHELVNGLAEYSKGFCEVITDADLIEKKVLQQLRRSMYSKISVAVGDFTYNLEPGQETLLCVGSDDEECQEFLDLTISNSDISDVYPIKWTNASLISLDDESDAEDAEGNGDAKGDGDGVEEGDSVEEGDAEENKMKKTTTIESLFSEKMYPLKAQWAKGEIEKAIKKMGESKDEDDTIRANVVSMSKEYGVLTKFTSFVGVLEGSESDDVADEILTSPLHPGKYAAGKKMNVDATIDNRRNFYSNAMNWAMPTSGATRMMMPGGGLKMRGFGNARGGGGGALAMKTSMRCSKRAPNFFESRGGNEVSRSSTSFRDVGINVGDLGNLVDEIDDMHDEEVDEDHDAGKYSRQSFSLSTVPPSVPKIQQRTSSLPKLLLTSSDTQAVTGIFSRALEFDGSVSYKKLKKCNMDLPDVPEDVLEDVWASLLFLAYMTVNKLQNTDEWKMTTDKTMDWLQKQGIEADAFRKYYEDAITLCSDE